MPHGPTSIVDAQIKVHAIREDLFLTEERLSICTEPGARDNLLGKCDELQAELHEARILLENPRKLIGAQST